MLSGINWRKHLLPREHGAWAMWIVPFVIGTIACDGFSVKTFQVLFSILMVFFARTSLASAMRLRTRDRSTSAKCIVIGACQIVAAVLCVFPFVLAGNIVFIGISVVAGVILLADLFWVRNRMERNLIIELAGVSGFVLSGPAVITANTGQWQYTAVWLWLLCFVYFAGSVFYVKLRLARTAVKGTLKDSESRYARLLISYTVTISMILVLLAMITKITGWFLISYIPWFLYLLKKGFEPTRNLNRVGWVLVLHSLYFTTVLSFFFMMNSGL